MNQGEEPMGMNPQHPHRPQYPLANYQFSAEELRVLRECNTESFFQRSLPLGTGLGLAMFYGVKAGYLKPSVRFGAVPKVVVGVIVGYFVGKFSYQQKCAEKIMRLPNSRLAEVLRQRKQGVNPLAPDSGLGMGLALSPFAPSGADVYSDEQYRHPERGSALSLDTERPTISGLDDIYRPSLDNPGYQAEPEIPIEPSKHATTYEELRQRNRDEYNKKQSNIMSRPLPPDAPVVVRRHEVPSKATDDAGLESSHAEGKRNKYGDIWTN